MALSRSDLTTTIYHEFLKSGDVVVGAYTDNGRQFQEGATPDTEQEVERRRQILAHSAAAAGGQLLEPIKKAMKAKKGKPIKAAKRNVRVGTGNPEPLTPALTAAEVANEKHVPSIKPRVQGTSQTVYLHNKLGRIKMKVEDVLDSEMAYCLIFSSEDDLIFTPNAGETLNFIDSKGTTHEVYYANTLFSWSDGIKQLMILFKRDE